MSQRLTKFGALWFGALAMLLAACSDSSSPSTTANTLTAAQAQDLGQDVAEDAAELSDASTFNTSTGISMMSGATPSGARLLAPPPACVAITPASPTNSDSDIIPDSVRWAYDCGFVRANGMVVDSVTGTIDFFDPQPTVPSLGLKLVFTAFTHQRINDLFPLRSFKAVHNGTREWGGNTDTLGHTITNFVTVWTHASGRTTTHAKTWAAKFVATTPGTIGLNVPLPAGAWTVNGTSTWTTLNRSWSVQVTTVAPLQYDPSCDVSPKFTSGTLDLVVTRNGAITNVEIVFTACGQYTVTKTSQTATAT
jgi:hypothetical protein